MMNKKFLLAVGTTALAASIVVPTLAFASAPKEERPTIKFVFDEDGGRRVSDEEFYNQFGDDCLTQKGGEEAAYCTEEIVSAPKEERPTIKFIF